MKGDIVLYEYVYQSLLNQIYSGDLRRGQRFPSQQEICRQYNVGITTVRKVIRMLEKDGVIRTAERKRPVVLYEEGNLSCISVLLQRKDYILDIYEGLEWLMPAFQLGGAKQYRDYDKLQALIDGVRDQMDRRELYVQTSHFLLELLRPYNNQILCDLHTDSENFNHIPCYPLSGLEERYSVTAAQVRATLSELLESMRKKDDPALARRLKEIYWRGWERTRRYLEALAARYENGREAVAFDGCTGKNRARLYTVVARRLYRRILDGEFDGCTYIPSIPELMREYAVSQATALAAVALLNDIGAVRTLDKKGTMVAAPGTELPPLRMNNSAIGENLVLCLDALQILAVCSGGLAQRILSQMTEEAVRAEVEKWDKKRTATSGMTVRTLLGFFKDNAPCKSLYSIFDRLDDFLIWGHYLERDWSAENDVNAKAAAHIAALRRPLEQRDAAAFAGRAQAILYLAYGAARRHMLAYGADPAMLPAALDASVLADRDIIKSRS